MNGNIKVNMNPQIILAALTLLITALSSYAQQYGWVDIGNNLPNSTGTASLADMYWISDSEGWICSSATGEIYHTTDGGNTFTTQTTQFYTNAIWMLNANEGYAGGYNGRVYRTTDGGSTWTVIGSIGSSLLSISFPPSSDTGYCCGDNGKIYRITSSGVSAMNSGVITSLRSISFPAIYHGWTCGDSHILHYYGSWSQQDPPVDAYNGIYMTNSTTGWAVGALGVIVNTTDEGLSWNYQSNPDTSTRALNDVFFFNASDGWAVGNSGVILHTTNGGTTWSVEGSGFTSNMLRAVQFTSSTNGYVLGNNKTLLKYTLTTGIKGNGQIPDAFSLEQNYPNPFNPSTTISYSLAIPARIKLSVYNIFGQQVVVLDEGSKPAGNFSVAFSGDDLPSGIYYYRLQCDDRHLTRKMTLIK